MKSMPKPQEIDTKAQTSTYQKHEWKIRVKPHNYLEDVAMLNQVGKDNFVKTGPFTKMSKFNSPYNGVNYWSVNVKPLPKPMGEKDNGPLPLGLPVIKPGNGNPWAPHTFKDPYDYYNSGKYIQY